jgi:hypothetical protein
LRALAGEAKSPLPALSRRSMPLLRSLVLLVSGGLALAACNASYAVGDRVLVDWETNTYPAVIIDAPGPTRFKVHYEGYDTVWDEVVPRTRIRGLVVGPVVPVEPPAKVRAKAIKAAQNNVYKQGEHVRVEWHGQLYTATITGIVGQEKYRVSYDGYGHEWDEIVGLARIQPK